MSEQKFYGSQPDVLPEKLPAGTRARGGDVADSELLLGDDERYCGMWTGMPGASSPYEGSLLARNVVWSSVPLPEPADRPIQAGDWVECVQSFKPGNPDAPSLKKGVRYTVFATLGPAYRIKELDNWAYAASYFKRVDGPHPDRIATQCSDAQCGGCDSCIQRQRDYYAEISSSPVGTGNAQSSGAGEARKCAECGAQPAPLKSVCAYCERRIMTSDLSAMLTTRCNDEARAASTRLLAGLASEKPRVMNRAAAAELAKPHPWSCDDEI